MINIPLQTQGRPYPVFVLCLFDGDWLQVFLKHFIWSQMIGADKNVSTKDVVVYHLWKSPEKLKMHS